MTVLGNQRPQNLDQFGGGCVLDGYDLRDEFFTGGPFLEVVIAGTLFGEDLLYDFNHISGRHRGVAVYPENAQEQLVDGLGVHRRAGNHRDVALDPGIDDEALAGDRGNLRDELADIRVLEIDLPVIVLAQCRQWERKQYNEEKPPHHRSDPHDKKNRNVT